MKISVKKVATINRHTQTTCAMADLTAPIHTGSSCAPDVPLSLWSRLWQRLRRKPVPAPRVVEPEAIVGTLVQFVRWTAEGRMDYNPFPLTADAAIEYEMPPVLLLDGNGVNGEERIFFTSPIYSISIGRYGLASRIETRSSLYEIRWLETPVLPIDEVADSG